MEKTTNKYDPITGKVSSVFWHYSIPEIVGLLAMSSAGLVDSIFLGNYVGAEALATISLSIPALTLFWAFAMLIAVGGSVVCGKYLGQKNQQQANEVFTSTMLVGLASAFLLLFIGIVFLDQIVGGLGATDQVLAELLEIYLGILMWFTPFFVLEIVVFYFVRLDGQPKLASGAFVVGSGVNVVLDWLFIVKFDWAMMGAAYATGISAVVTCSILLPYFFKRSARLKFSKPMRDWAVLLKAYINGVSEFANEASIGVTTLIFNWVMITRLGMEGVAALTIMDNIWVVGLYISIGMCDSQQPIISQNYGAQNHQRIVKFLRISAFSVLGVGALMIASMVFFPDMLISIFLEPDEVRTRQIASQFMLFLWPAFLFIGLNILLSVYFTSMQKPAQSTFIAFSRSFVFPAVGLLVLPIWFGDVGMYLALPIAEGLTFIMAVTFFMKCKPIDIIRQDTTIGG
ncbi:MAG: MATE family efflux transporter [Gammaproteobacteria bacterium]|nr:MATE family efflux transporter [Gammaproteobacteria bacterium]